MLTPEALSAIRSQLEPYHTAFCSLKHEKVTELSRFEDIVYTKRYGFCDKAVRRYRLGCAHTNANQEFCSILSSIDAQFPGAQALAEEFDHLFLKVYMMDLTKGVLEKQLAMAIATDKPELISEAQKAVGEVIATHHQLIKNIEELRAGFMAGLLSS